MALGTRWYLKLELPKLFSMTQNATMMITKLFLGISIDYTQKMDIIEQK